MRVIDISHKLSDSIPVYPGDQPVSLIKVKSYEKFFYNSYLLNTCLHAGTHIDAPMHILNENQNISDFDVNNFVGKGIVLDVRGENPISMKSYYKDLDFAERIVLLYTGFDLHFSNTEYFTSYPSVSRELALFLLDSGIKVLGLDTPSPDYFPFEIHKLLLSNEIFIIENLTGLGSLLELQDFEIFALPLKIEAEASLIRAVCVVRD